MDPARLIFDSSSSHRYHGQRMLLLGSGGVSPVFGGAISSLAEGANKRRPFFTSPDEILEEEYYYDEQLPEKKRRLMPDQVVERLLPPPSSMRIKVFTLNDRVSFCCYHFSFTHS